MKKIVILIFTFISFLSFAQESKQEVTQENKQENSQESNQENKQEASQESNQENKQEASQESNQENKQEAAQESNQENKQEVAQESKEEKIETKSEQRYIEEIVTVRKRDSLAKILRRYLKEDSVITKKTPMVQMIFQQNPDIKNWRKLKRGKKIRILLNPDYVDNDKTARARKYEKKLERRRRILAKRRKKMKKFSVFYMASVGEFSQESSQLSSVKFKQNSPVTFGAMYTYRPKRKKYSFSTSTYFSYLLAATSNVNDKSDVAVPLEVGLNIYYQNVLGKNKTNQWYAGFDYEKFNTFNLAAAKENNEIAFDENQLFFVTIGYTKVFKMWKKNFVFKTSLAQSIASVRQIGFSDDTDDSAYSGQKLMLFLMSTIKKNFYLSTLFKFHKLKGPSDVTSSRIGIGAGYSF